MSFFPVYGIVHLPLWGYLVIAFILTHITIIAVTLYLHRCQAHRSLDMHPWVSHFFRFWLWLTTGMITRQWVAVHRKHHAKCETIDDPHSPYIVGINKVLFQGAALYRRAAKNSMTIEDYGHGTPDDWIESHLYSAYPFGGILCMAVLDILGFGLVGILIWMIQMAWIPFWAAGVINGLGHYWGYRNYDTTDGSTNLVNIAWLIGGEELHNNHHAFPSSAKFSSKPWEFDLGWLYLKCLSAAHLVKIKKTAPKLELGTPKEFIDIETAKAVVIGRLYVLANYARDVISPVFCEVEKAAKAQDKIDLKSERKFFLKHQFRQDSRTMQQLFLRWQHYERLKIVLEFRDQLKSIWECRQSTESLIVALQTWCKDAESTSISVLQEFSKVVRSYYLEQA